MFKSFPPKASSQYTRDVLAVSEVEAYSKTLFARLSDYASKRKSTGGLGSFVTVDDFTSCLSDVDVDVNLAQEVCTFIEHTLFYSFAVLLFLIPICVCVIVQVEHAFRLSGFFRSLLQSMTKAPAAKKK